MQGEKAPILFGELRSQLAIKEAEEAAEVLSQDPLHIALTVGQQIAQHSLGVRRKYGRYPLCSQVVVCGLHIPWAFPLPGHEDDQIIPFPDTSERALRRRPLNRQDDRQRFRFWKQESFTKNLHEKVGAGKHKHGLGSRGRRIRSVPDAEVS